MRPGAVLVAVLSLILAVGGVAWLAQSLSGVNVTASSSKPAVKIEDEPDFPVPSPTGPHPVVKFEEIEHNFGTRPRYSKGSHKFIVRNDGEATLKLKSGKTTCQCTVGELGQNTVAPGESTTIELSWEIRQPGPGFQHSAEIHTNDPLNPSQTLIVKGFVGVDVGIWPEARWSMGSLKSDGSAKMDGYIFSHVSDGLELTTVESSLPGLSFETAQLTQEEANALSAKMAAETAEPPDPHGNNAEPERPEIKSAVRVTVSADNQIPVGQFSIPITMHTTLESVPTVSIPVTGVRPGPYQFFPLPGTSYRHGSMLIDAGPLKASEEHTAGLLVICRGFNDELKLTEVETDPSWLKVELEPAPGDGDIRRYRLLLKFPSGMPPMFRTSANPATLKISTNHPDAKTLSLKAAFVVEE